MSYTRYEKARILGARSLQLAMGAPSFIDYEGNINPLELAKKELEEGKIPITVAE